MRSLRMRLHYPCMISGDRTLPVAARTYVYDLYFYHNEGRMERAVCEGHHEDVSVLCDCK